MATTAEEREVGTSPMGAVAEIIPRKETSKSTKTGPNTTLELVEEDTSNEPRINPNATILASMEVGLAEVVDVYSHWPSPPPLHWRFQDRAELHTIPPAAIISLRPVISVAGSATIHTAIALDVYVGVVDVV